MDYYDAFVQYLAPWS